MRFAAIFIAIAALTIPAIAFAQPSFECDDSVEELAKTLHRARANGKAVVGMKIFGAGKLTRPEDREASLRYVIGQGLVDAMTIGTTAPEQFDDNLQAIKRAISA